MRWHWELERRLRAIKSVPSPRFAGALSAVGRVCGSYPAVDAAVQELSQNRNTTVSWLLCGFGFFCIWQAASSTCLLFRLWLLWAGEALEPPATVGCDSLARQPQRRGLARESAGLASARPWVIMLTHVRFPKEGLVSLILVSWRCQQFTVLLDYIECSLQSSDLQPEVRQLMQTEKAPPFSPKPSWNPSLLRSVCLFGHFPFVP